MTLDYMPPAEYRYMPGPATNIITISPELMPSTCGDRADGLVGCAFVTRTHCTVYIADNLTPQVRSQVLIHERAHCRGWRHP